METDQFSAVAGGAFALFAGVFLFLIFILIVVGFLSYLLFALGVFKMAKNKNCKNPWMAFIPFVNFYTLGQILEPLNIFGKDIKNAPLVLMVLSLASLFISPIPVIGQLLSLAIVIFMYMVFYKLYEMYSNNASIYIILSIIFPGIGVAIIVFLLRNNKPKLATEPVVEKEDNFSREQ